MAEAGLIIDTLEDVRELVKSGMPEPQAETVVRQRVRLLEGNLATKADIAAINAQIAATNANVETLREETSAQIAETNAQIAETNANVEKLRQETSGQIAETNARIETLRQETSGEIAQTNARIETLRQETEKLIALCKVDIIKWVVGANLGIAAIVVAAVKLL